MAGICYGISVGPGAYGLITLEALDIIRKADIVFLPSFPKEECRAYLAAKESLPEIDEKELRCETFTMSKDVKVMKERHEEIYNAVVKELSDGKIIAFLTLGEVGLYSTYLYIHGRLLRNGYDSRLISGISSVQEIADKLGLPLAGGNVEVHIFPNTEELDKRLSMQGMKIFMKPKGSLLETVEMIRHYAASHEGIRAFGISNCGMENEIIALDADELCRLNGYFTVIFVTDSPDIL